MLLMPCHCRVFAIDAVDDIADIFLFRLLSRHARYYAALLFSRHCRHAALLQRVDMP